MFELGRWHVLPSILIYRRDIQTIYDKWEPAATIYVSSEGGARGIAQCFPQVIRQEIRQAVGCGLGCHCWGAIGYGKVI